MRAHRLLGVSAVVVFALALGSSSALASSNIQRTGLGPSPLVAKPKVYEVCEAGSCFGPGVPLNIYTKSKEWSVAAIAGHYAKVGKVIVFKVETEYNFGCEFLMKKKGKNYVGETATDCYGPNVAYEFRYLS